MGNAAKPAKGGAFSFAAFVAAFFAAHFESFAVQTPLLFQPPSHPLRARVFNLFANL